MISNNFEVVFSRKLDKHILNSHGVLNFSKFQMDGVRLGIGLYGSTNDANLKQISSLTSVIAQIRELKKGDYVWIYETSFYCQGKMKIGIVPVGYVMVLIDGLVILWELFWLKIVRVLLLVKLVWIVL